MTPPLVDHPLITAIVRRLDELVTAKRKKAMEKRGVLVDEMTAPEAAKKQASDQPKAPKPACGEDAMSKAAEAAAVPPKRKPPE